MKTKKPKEKLLKEKFEWTKIFEWAIRIFGLFLIICWFFFYRTPISFSDGNIFYRMGAVAEGLVILLVLYKITIFNLDKEK